MHCYKDLDFGGGVQRFYKLDTVKLLYKIGLIFSSEGQLVPLISRGLSQNVFI